MGLLIAPLILCLIKDVGSCGVPPWIVGAVVEGTGGVGIETPPPPADAPPPPPPGTSALLICAIPLDAPAIIPAIDKPAAILVCAMVLAKLAVATTVVIGLAINGAAAAVAADIARAESTITLPMAAPCSITIPAIASFLFFPATCPNRLPKAATLPNCKSCIVSNASCFCFSESTINLSYSSFCFFASSSFFFCSSNAFWLASCCLFNSSSSYFLLMLSWSNLYSSSKAVKSFTPAALSCFNSSLYLISLSLISLSLSESNESCASVKIFSAANALCLASCASFSFCAFLFSANSFLFLSLSSSNFTSSSYCFFNTSDELRDASSIFV